MAHPITHPSTDTVRVRPWPTEELLFGLSVIVSVTVWLLLVVSIIGIAYALAIGVLLFMGHLMLIGHIRGNGVRLGPNQFPEIHEMVERLSRRIGLSQVPEAYLMQEGGTLNAFATRFLSTDIVVLYSDLLAACGENRAACEMIVGHELAHVKRGHLRWHWFLVPSYLVPFLGMALSRAREYTCDRYGHALAGDTNGALLGLTILAAGGSHGPRVNQAALVAQQESLNTGFMRLAEWMSTHPPLASRLVELNPALATMRINRARGTRRACAIVGTVVLPFVIAGVAAAVFVPRWFQSVQQQQLAASAEEESTEDRYEAPPVDLADGQVTSDFQRIAAFLQEEAAAGRALPLDARELYKRWNQVRRYEFSPFDPFDGARYGYTTDSAAFVLWSSGPDAIPDTEDDIYFDSRRAGRGVGRRPQIGIPSPDTVSRAVPPEG